ncbi:hypothetical protein pf16_58 [Pseudomonas phage pf16]|uniref:Carrier domain-containing protein n=1 Tax=Pseudomonas phage pf16 TaxID=1815630 RepID=A0A1S5R3K8_9CAUD|nr:acyl carrier protein [Pseudomonas phage pf16]AND74981.1 hypothetical protein pf16_58 [Pseudomonas phage pf16]
MSTTLNKVTAALAEQLGLNADEINILEPIHELGTDSLDNIEIIMRLEEDFCIEIPDEFADKFVNATVMDVVRAIDSDLTIEPPSAVAPVVAFKSQGCTFQQMLEKVDPENHEQHVIGVLGDITVTVDKHFASVKVDGSTVLTLDRSNGNLEDLCRLLMKSSTK